MDRVDRRRPVDVDGSDATARVVPRVISFCAARHVERERGRETNEPRKKMSVVSPPTEFDPDARASRREASALRIDAAPAFGARVLVDTTPSEVRRLVARLRAEPRATVISLSNARYRRGLECQWEETEARAQHAGEEGREAWARACGDVLVFYCARFVLDGRALPCRA